VNPSRFPNGAPMEKDAGLQGFFYVSLNMSFPQSPVKEPPPCSLKAPPDRREIFAATAKPSLRILSWTGMYTATSGSPHTGAKKSRRRLQNCSDLFTVAARTVFCRCHRDSAGFTLQFQVFAPAGDKNVLCRQAPEGRSRQVSFLFLIQSHI